jgi:hypothetical protein
MDVLFFFLLFEFRDLAETVDDLEKIAALVVFVDDDNVAGI